MLGSRKRDDNRENPVHTMVIINTRCSVQPCPSSTQAEHIQHPLHALLWHKNPGLGPTAGSDLTQSQLFAQCREHTSPRGSTRRSTRAQSSRLQVMLRPHFSWEHSKAVLAAAVTCSAHEKDSETQLLVTKKRLRSISFLERFQQRGEHPEPMLYA